MAISILLEHTKTKKPLERGYSGYKRADVGSGWGKMIGAGVTGGIGAPAGAIAGHYTGKGLIKRPHEKIDEEKKLHRIGVMASEQLRAKRLAKGAGAGAALGGLAGYTAKKLSEQEIQGIQHSARVVSELTDAEATAAAIAAGAGATGGTIAAIMKGGHKAAKKLGYGKAGRIAGTLTPATGLFTPKKLRTRTPVEPKEK